MSDWISVNDKRPPALTTVLGYGYGEFVLMHTGNDGWVVPFMTHWMPLPEPPKEEEDDRQRERDKAD